MALASRRASSWVADRITHLPATHRIDTGLGAPYRVSMRPVAHRAARLLAVLLAVLVAGAPLHTSLDDICDAQPTVHNHAAHRLNSQSRQTSEPEHCALCHSVQALASGVLAAAVVAPPPESSGQSLAARAVAASVVLAASDPTRGPPALTL